MHQGIDLSRFRKVSSDGKTTTLRHTKGHEVKIAHGALSDKMRDHINTMPIHLAEGEDVPEKILEPAVQEVAPQQLAEATPQETYEVMDSAPAESAAQSSEQKPEEAVVDTSEPPAYKAPPKKEFHDTTDEFGHVTKAQEYQDADTLNEHIKYATDLATHKIKPSTYHSLFAKKDTLGKIGTLFGLLVSGAGSGLAHQPNMLMEMMNKQIDQDLEAQKADRENARNFLSVQSNINLQKSQARAHDIDTLTKGVEGAKAAAITGKVVEGINKSGVSPFLQNYMKVRDSIMSDYEGKAKALESAGDHLDKISKTNPQANATYHQVVKPALQQKVAQTLHDGKQAADIATKDMVKAPAVNSDLLTTAMATNVIPGDSEKLSTEAKNVEGLNDAVYQYYHGFNILKDLPFGGKAPGAGILSAVLNSIPGVHGEAVTSEAKEFYETERKQQITQLEAAFYKGGMSHEHAKDVASSIMPGYNKDPKVMAEAFNQGMTKLKNEYENQPTLKRYNKIYPTLFKQFPKLPYVAPVIQKGSAQAPKGGPAEAPKEEPKTKYKPIMKGW